MATTGYIGCRTTRYGSDEFIHVHADSAWHLLRLAARGGFEPGHTYDYGEAFDRVLGDAFDGWLPFGGPNLGYDHPDPDPLAAAAVYSAGFIANGEAVWQEHHLSAAVPDPDPWAQAAQLVSEGTGGRLTFRHRGHALIAEAYGLRFVLDDQCEDLPDDPHDHTQGWYLTIYDPAEADEIWATVLHSESLGVAIATPRAAGLQMCQLLELLAHQRSRGAADVPCPAVPMHGRD